MTVIPRDGERAVEHVDGHGNRRRAHPRLVPPLVGLDDPAAIAGAVVAEPLGVQDGGASARPDQNPVGGQLRGDDPGEHGVTIVPQLQDAWSTTGRWP